MFMFVGAVVSLTNVYVLSPIFSVPTQFIFRVCVPSDIDDNCPICVFLSAESARSVISPLSYWYLHIAALFVFIVISDDDSDINWFGFSTVICTGASRFTLSVFVMFVSHPALSIHFINTLYDDLSCIPSFVLVIVWIWFDLYES